MLWFVQYIIYLKYHEMTIFRSIIIIYFQQINSVISKYMVRRVGLYTSKENVHLGHAQTVNLKSTWIFGNLAMMFLKWNFTFKFHLHLKISSLSSLWRTFSAYCAEFSIKEMWMKCNFEFAIHIYSIHKNENVCNVRIKQFFNSKCTYQRICW